MKSTSDRHDPWNPGRLLPRTAASSGAKWRYLRRVQFIVGPLTAVLTVAAAGWQIAESRRTYKQSRRAWMVVVGVAPLASPTVGQRARFVVLYRNTGPTPALDFRTKVGMLHTLPSHEPLALKIDWPT